MMNHDEIPPPPEVEGSGVVGGIQLQLQQQQQQQQRHEVGGGRGDHNSNHNHNHNQYDNDNGGVDASTNYNYPNYPNYPFPSTGAIRFPAWVALSILSILAWIAMISRKHLDTAAFKYSISVATLTTVFSILSVVAYIFYRGIYMSQAPEIALSGIVLVLWTSGLPVIMNPQNGIAVSYTQVENANLYFASWFIFICILWISFSLIQETYGMDVINTHLKPFAKSKQGHWYALVATSIVVVSASVRIFQADQCSIKAMKDAPICIQTKYAISAGVIGTFVSSAITYQMVSGATNTAEGSSNFALQHEFVGSICMFVIWIFGMGFITFGEGPGHSIGNLYFATWGCFILSILIISECYQEYLTRREQANQIAATSVTEDLQLEEIPPGENPFAATEIDDVEL